MTKKPELTVVPAVPAPERTHTARRFTEVPLFNIGANDIGQVALPSPILEDVGVPHETFVGMLGSAIAPFASLLPDGRGYSIFVVGEEITISGLIEAPAPAAAVDDGRPCHTDVFLGRLLAECHDHYDKKDAIQNWLEGDWPGALEYLSIESVIALTEGKA